MTKKKGLYPLKGLFKKLVGELKLTRSLNIRYTIEDTKPIIDSSNLESQDWRNILEKLQENYHKYDTFILVHGTDTLAYTASLLSFFCRNWKKSIVVTGSQIPMFEFRNDADKNLQDSIIMSLYKIPQVFVVFGGEVLRGNCTTKYSSMDFQAYSSPDAHAVGKFGVALQVDAPEVEEGLVKKSPFLERNLPNTFSVSKWNPDIWFFTLTLTPGMKFGDIKTSIFSTKLPDAIIIRSYGAGNAPVSDQSFFDFLKLAHKHNIVVVNTTQCVAGGVEMELYDTGRQLLAHHVVGSGNMTFESTYAKLFYLFQVIGTGNTPLIKKLFTTNIAGELYKPAPYSNTIQRVFKRYQEI